MDESLQGKTEEAIRTNSDPNTDLISNQPNRTASEAYLIANKAIDPVKHERNKEKLRIEQRRVRLNLAKMRIAPEHKRWYHLKNLQRTP